MHGDVLLNSALCASSSLKDTHAFFKQNLEPPEVPPPSQNKRISKFFIEFLTLRLI
uniref:Uncharacterized protein n=1 Tax=Oryza brachyantha TaxID=4533 RepID=J3LKG5_ORYBR